MDTRTLILTLVRFGTSPDVLRIIQPHLGYTDDEWDDAIELVAYEERSMEAERQCWLLSLQSSKERERGFEEEGAVSADQRLVMKQRYLEAEYERLLRKDERTQDDEKRLERIRNEYRARFANDGITQDDIERAKMVSIGRIIKITRNFANCPFHNEKTPSLCVYKNNTFHCFGCGVNGDVIHLIRHMRGLGFVEAVRWLLSA